MFAPEAMKALVEVPPNHAYIEHPTSTTWRYLAQPMKTMIGDKVMDDEVPEECDMVPWTGFAVMRGEVERIEDELGRCIAMLDGEGEKEEETEDIQATSSACRIDSYLSY